MERPEANSRWICDSVVRAPIAPQAMVSAIIAAKSCRGIRLKLDAFVGHIDQQLTTNAQALIDAEAAIEVWIVQQAFPANRRPRFSK